MSAKEKALELVTEQLINAPGLPLSKAKLYAQYVVDDIILQLPMGPMYRNSFIYWQDVKKEIDLIEQV